MQVRVRYAPSPTGLQHIGGVRTALFNYLFARSMGGKFILRLEDTDRSRFSQEYVKNLYDTFEWLGVKWDEGPDSGGPAAPYVQSERFEIYRAHAERLVALGRAYYCFCGEDRVSKFHSDVQDEEGAAEGASFGYDRHCRTVDVAEAKVRAASERHVIRLKIPLGETTEFEDRLLGKIVWKNEDVNPDPVLLKSDGFPTYHLANVVDDHLMGITHVMRAQEWISSTPLHVVMYKAFGWEPPAFCHLPMVMGEDGRKLSKRHGATSVDEFRKGGYLPEALLNYVGMLGASYEDGRDLYALAEMEKLFSIEHLKKAPAIFDYKRLEWFNGQYIRQKPDAELAALVMPWLEEAGVARKGDAASEAAVLAAMPLAKERLHYLRDAPAVMGFLFAESPVPAPEEFFPKKFDAAMTRSALAEARALLAARFPASDEELEEAYRARAAELGLKLGDLLMPLRVAVTGSRASPPLFGSIRLLGLDKALARIDRSLAALGA